MTSLRAAGVESTTGEAGENRPTSIYPYAASM
jgi:hypothetical protein